MLNFFTIFHNSDKLIKFHLLGVEWTLIRNWYIKLIFEIAWGSPISPVHKNEKSWPLQEIASFLDRYELWNFILTKYMRM